LILDVGCGNFPTGDVNCDLYIKDVGHRTGKIDKRTPPLAPCNIKNFVWCDVQHLPFRDSIFEKVYSSHVIEHVKDPYLLFKEMLRTSNSKVVILCPHRFGDRLQGHNPYHIHFLNKSWFFKVARNFNVFISIVYSDYLHVPFRFLSLFRVPLEMKVKLQKKSTGMKKRVDIRTQSGNSKIEFDKL